MLSKNDLTLAYRIARPGRRKRSKMLRTLIRAIDTRELPDDFPETTLIWRNTASQDQRSDDFLTAMNESRSGFLTLTRRRLERDVVKWEAIEAMEATQRATRRAEKEATIGKAKRQKKTARKKARRSSRRVSR